MIPLAGLHAHNEYSLLDGAGTAAQHARAALDAGYLALAETNHGTLAGTLHHMRACREAGIMPIVGVEAYYRPNRKVQGQKEWLREYSHLTLLAKDLRGWYSLMRIVSESHSTGFYGKACVDDELLDLHHEGLICLTGCVGGRLAKSIIAEDHRQAEAWIRQLRRIFRDDLYVEIMPHDYAPMALANVEAVSMAQRHSIPIVTTIDSHYPTVEWAPTQDVLLMIATNQTLKKREKKRQEGEDVYEFTMKTFYHMTSDEIWAMFMSYHPTLAPAIVEESMRNTMFVAAQTTPFLVDRSEKMPTVSFPGEESNEAYLRRLAFEGLARRGYAGDKVYGDQVEFELNTFIKLNSVDQMLMAWDVVDWAKSDRPIPKRKSNGTLVYTGKKKPIMVGPGRGSAAGSTVGWAIGITNVNPIKHRLMFERFLNPDRVGKPDIDIDFGPERVDEVEKYVKARYGPDRVVDIIAHSTFGPRAALSDVGRVLCVPYDHVKGATKTIDDNERSPLELLRQTNPAVERFAADHPYAFEQSKMIQGMVARKSEHAGGLLILDRPVGQSIPVERTGGQKGKLLSAFGERSGKGNALISDYGYNKLDVLRVAELHKQQRAVDLYEQRTGERVLLDDLAVHDDPYAVEPEVMRIFHDGLLVGVFQFSATAARLTRKVKPDNLFDLASINALIRPGPRGAGMDADYVERKHGRQERSIWHPLLEPYLNHTQNLMVFQEQLVEVVHRLGGLTKAQSDIFRKIASKLYRDPEYARATMGEWYVPIREGFMRNGVPSDIFGNSGVDDGEPTGIWKQFLSFSDYSFNLCLTGDTIVERRVEMSKDDDKVTINDLFGAQESNSLERVQLLQMSDDFYIHPAKMKRVLFNGLQETFKIVLRDGKEITATANHRFLTLTGYVRVKDLYDREDYLVVREGCSVRHSLIESITPFGIQPVFDIEMDSDEHNFVANGIISHNSHAEGYSLLAYRDAWLKVHMPREFYAAFLSVGLSQITGKKILQKAEAVREARHRGYKIMPPDVNDSGRDYTVVEDGIRLGLLSIKNVGPATAAALEEHRPFESYEDLERRCPRGAVNVQARASLIMSGACDRWGKRDRFTEEHIDELERGLLGMSLTSATSIAAYSDAIEGRFWTEDEFDAEEEGAMVCVVGEVVAVKEHKDKKGNTMAFIDLVYGPNNWSCTLFAGLYATYRDLIESKRPLLVTGTKSTHKGRASVRVEGLPENEEGVFTPPVMDLGDFAGMIMQDATAEHSSSIYPEDWAETKVEADTRFDGDGDRKVLGKSSAG